MFGSLFCVGDCCEVTVFALPLARWSEVVLLLWLLEHRSDGWSRVHPDLLLEPQTQTCFSPDEVLNFSWISADAHAHADWKTYHLRRFFSHAILRINKSISDSLGSCTFHSQAYFYTQGWGWGGRGEPEAGNIYIYIICEYIYIYHA